jgi:hypothetical protein
VPIAAHVVEAHLPEPPARAPAGEDVEADGLLKALVLILAAMWAGSWLTIWFASVGLTLPAYIGAMLVAAVLRNVDDGVRLIGISQQTIDDLGSTALSLFLVMALMTLRLWDLVGLAAPLAIMLAAQVLAVSAKAIGPLFWLMGRDYESAVISSGFCRLHARHDRKRDGEHEGARGALRSGAEGIPAGADGGRVLHRFYERAHHHGVPEHLAMNARANLFPPEGDRFRSRRDPRSRAWWPTECAPQRRYFSVAIHTPSADARNRQRCRLLGETPIGTRPPRAGS